MAIAVTYISTSVGGLTWMLTDWIHNGRPSALGLETGAIAGLAAMTPASGYVGPLGAFLIGLVSGIFCYLASTTIKNRFGYDDSLDVFGVHGVGGFVGTVLVAIFASEVLAENQAGLPIPHQLQVQFGAGLGVALYIGIASWLIPKCVDMLVGLRLASDGTRRMMRRLDSI